MYSHDYQRGTGYSAPNPATDPPALTFPDGASLVRDIIPISDTGFLALPGVRYGDASTQITPLLSTNNGASFFPTNLPAGQTDLNRGIVGDYDAKAGLAAGYVIAMRDASDGNKAKVYRSPDGTAWSALATVTGGDAAAPFAMVANHGRWLVDQVGYSSDGGATWNPMGSGWHRIKRLGGVILAVRDNGASPAAYRVVSSRDGVTFATEDLPPIPGVDPAGIPVMRFNDIVGEG
jgi:hypothetical protein